MQIYILILSNQENYNKMQWLLFYIYCSSFPSDWTLIKYKYFISDFFLKIFYLFIFREKGREGEREEEKH